MCAVVVARRKQGRATAWRLLVVAAFVSSLVGDLLWYGGRDSADGTAPPLAVALYFLPPLLTLMIAGLLVRTGGPVHDRRDGPVRSSRVVTVLDGLVAAIAFMLLVYISGFGDRTGAVLPRSDNAAVLVVYALLELVVVVTAMLTAITYRRDRAYRANYLLLACGVVMIASSDRMVIYLRTVGLEGGQLWGSIGFVLGQLLITYAVLDLPRQPATKRGRDAVEWVQLALPYIGFLGMAVLYSFHLYIGKRLNGIRALRRGCAGVARRGSTDDRHPFAPAVDRAPVRRAEPARTSGTPRLVDGAAQPAALRASGSMRRSPSARSC